MSNIELESRFVSPLIDIAFKTCWLSGDKYLNAYFKRIIEYALNRSIDGYELGPNETGVHSMENIANKVDILLVSDNKKIDIELNNIKDTSGPRAIKTALNKSLVCLAYYASTFYDKDDLSERYKNEMSVELINLNAFHSIENPKVIRADFKLYDPNNKISQDGIEYHNIYLPRMKELCYNASEDILKDFGILMCESYEEMEKLAKGNKGRESLVKMLKKLGRNSGFMSAIDREEYYEILKARTIEHYKSEAIKEGLEQGLEKGLEQGIEQGLEQGIQQGLEQGIAQGIEQGIMHANISTITNLLKDGMNIEKIASIVELSVEEVKTLISEKGIQ